ncbi:hypothetical protein B0H16DRAFT_1713001 [Mycena metata]|uniref:Uncharacterized protein n=1 Tax=Mycena metata TaxID=1033252 RepID=A0AAD7K481_9AGAR|nr:hypothetical protein B0H16DRAFT_1713001 [Mycena metata]
MSFRQTIYQNRLALLLDDDDIGSRWLGGYCICFWDYIGVTHWYAHRAGITHLYTPNTAIVHRAGITHPYAHRGGTPSTTIVHKAGVTCSYTGITHSYTHRGGSRTVTPTVGANPCHLGNISASPTAGAVFAQRVKAFSALLPPPVGTESAPGIASPIKAEDQRRHHAQDHTTFFLPVSNDHHDEYDSATRGDSAHCEPPFDAHAIRTPAAVFCHVPPTSSAPNTTAPARCRRRQPPVSHPALRISSLPSLRLGLTHPPFSRPVPFYPSRAQSTVKPAMEYVLVWSGLNPGAYLHSSSPATPYVPPPSPPLPSLQPFVDIRCPPFPSPDAAPVLVAHELRRVIRHAPPARLCMHARRAFVHMPPSSPGALHLISSLDPTPPTPQMFRHLSPCFTSGIRRYTESEPTKLNNTPTSLPSPINNLPIEETDGKRYCTARLWVNTRLRVLRARFVRSCRVPRRREPFLLHISGPPSYTGREITGTPDSRVSLPSSTSVDATLYRGLG